MSTTCSASFFVFLPIRLLTLSGTIRYILTVTTFLGCRLQTQPTSCFVTQNSQNTGTNIETAHPIDDFISFLIQVHISNIPEITAAERRENHGCFIGSIRRSEEGWFGDVA